MLLNQACNIYTAYPSQQLPYDTVESLYEDMPKQSAVSNSAGKHGHSMCQVIGGSNRIAKPGSTNNSPRSHAITNRRRTMIGNTLSTFRNGPASRPVASLSLLNNTTHHTLHNSSHSARPVSWHPSSNFTPQAQPYQITPSFTGFDTALISMGCSNYDSPASSFSPLSLPLTENRYQHSPDGMPNYFSPLNFTNTFYSCPQPSTTGSQLMTNPSQLYSVEWDDFVANGFNSVTNPPTPEVFNQQIIFEPEPLMSYQSTQVVEQGEELVALGLYDDPVKDELPDPCLDNYHSSMQQFHSQTLYQRPSSRPGKGLKLEESWAPPPSEEDLDSGEHDDGRSPELLPGNTNVLQRRVTVDLTDSEEAMPFLRSHDINGSW